MASKTRTKQLHVWLEDEQYAELHQIAAALGIVRSTFVRHVVATAIATHASAIKTAGPEGAREIGAAIQKRERERLRSTRRQS